MEVALELPLVPDVELVAAKAVQVLGRSLGMTDGELESVTVATVEACLNAMEHGGRDRFFVRVRTSGGNGPAALTVEVEDHGKGFDPECVPGSGASRVQGCVAKRGWGLRLIRELMDEVEVRSRPGKTVVRMVKHVGDT